MTRSFSRTAPRTRYSLQDLLLATALVAVYLTALTGLRRGLAGDDVSAYWCGVVSGAVCGLGFEIGRRPAVNQLGMLRVRLGAQVNWWGVFLGQAVLLLVFVMIVYALLWLSERGTWSIIAGSALGTTSCAWYSLRTLFRPQVELREQGIAAGIWTAIPWSKVKLRRWEPKSSGQLELACWFMRTVAYVPEELRDEVDALLREKLKLPDAVS